MAFCVYKHTSPSGKVYIGITSQKIEYRWNSGKGYTKNPYFSKAINKYGWDNISHEILFDGLTEQDAKRKEAELIKEYKSNNINYGYNIMSVGELAVARHREDSIEKMRVAKLGKKATEETRQKHRNAMLGRKMSEEVKEKISATQRGIPRNKHTEEWKQNMSEFFTDNTWNMKPVCQYEKSGTLIKKYISAKQAERETGCDNRNILAVCSEKRKSVSGYVWKYAGE